LLRGQSGRGGSFPSAVNEKNNGGTDRKKDSFDFSKRLLLAEEEAMAVTLMTAIEEETATIVSFIQQSLDHVRNSILERNNDPVLDDYLALDLISNIRSMYNDDDAGGEYYQNDDRHRALVHRMAGNEQLRHTNNAILENVIKGLPAALENDKDWEVFVSSYIPGVIDEGLMTTARAIATVHHDRSLEVDDKQKQQQQQQQQQPQQSNGVAVGDGGASKEDAYVGGGGPPNTVLEELLYLLRKFVFGPMVGVVLWMIKSPLFSYCIFCRLYEEEEMPFCLLATERICRNAPQIPDRQEQLHDDGAKETAYQNDSQV
jgi:hypothetical protein